MLDRRDFFPRGGVIACIGVENSCNRIKGSGVKNRHFLCLPATCACGDSSGGSGTATDGGTCRFKAVNLSCGG